MRLIRRWLRGRSGSGEYRSDRSLRRASGRTGAEPGPLPPASDVAGDATRERIEQACDELLNEELELLRGALKGYEVLERVRHGGQGVVYRAQQRGTQRIVALKVLLDGPLATVRQRDRFAREIELVARLRHPNIVTVHDSGVVRGRNFYAMEFIDGDPIDDAVSLRDLEPRAIVRMYVKVCRAVQHAHQNGIIHRDLNPANILVDADGEPRVFDFGLAKDLWQSDPGVTCTMVGCGTLPYLSPEQAGAGDGKSDVRTDVHALGLVLYELLTGMLPYPVQGDPEAVRKTIAECEPLPLRAALALGDPHFAPGRGVIDRDLELILARALAKRKEDRYQAAAELADDLERWLAGTAVSVRNDRVYILRKTLRRHRLAAIVTAVVVIAGATAGAGITWYWLQARAERDRARTERDNARAAARLAYGLFDMALTEVEEAVRPLPGGIAVRDRLVERLGRELPELETLAHSDAALAPVALQLLEKQGDVAWQQGRRADARRCYGAFLEEIRQRSAADPRDAQLAAALLRAHARLARVVDAPVSVLRAGLAAAEALPADVRADEGCRLAWCTLLKDLAAQYSDAEADEAALQIYAELLALCPESDGPAAAGAWAALRAGARYRQAQVLARAGRAGEALAASQEGVAYQEQFLRREPSNVEARRALFLARKDLADRIRQQSRPRDALAVMNQAAREGELLATLDPGWRQLDESRFWLHRDLATLEMSLKALPEARAQVEIAVALAGSHLAGVPDPDTDNLNCEIWKLRGRLAAAEGCWDEALRFCLQAVAASGQLAARKPNEPASLVYRAAAHTDAAKASLKCGEPHQALRHAYVSYMLNAWNARGGPEAARGALRVLSSAALLAEAHVTCGTAADLAEARRLLAAGREELACLFATGRIEGLESYSSFVQTRFNQVAYWIEQVESNRVAADQSPPQGSVSVGSSDPSWIGSGSSASRNE